MDTLSYLQEETYRGFEYQIYRTRRGWWVRLADICEGPFDYKGDALKWLSNLVDWIYQQAILAN
jgi:hypothetical protein